MDNMVKLIAEELVIACKRAYKRGIQTGSGGNVSARIPGKDLMLVKESGSSLGDSTAEGFVITDFDGNMVEGTGKPTREAFLHGLLYKLCPEVNAIVHFHAPYAIGWASTGKYLPRVTWHSKLKISEDIPVIDIPSAMVREEDSPLIEKMFMDNPKLTGFVLVDHGIVAMDKDPINALHNAELIEETAQVAILKELVGKLGI
ncbi:MAG: class II aldolase/adducin family protein [Anaerolineaceae bacterium]|nr:MAG: class II aldolase/adducin family protein [Anaerolineaceae bacterium]